MGSNLALKQPLSPSPVALLQQFSNSACTHAAGLTNQAAQSRHLLTADSTYKDERVKSQLANYVHAQLTGLLH